MIHNGMFSLASIGTIAASLFLLGLFFFVTMNVRFVVKEAEQNVGVTVLFDEGITEEQMQVIGDAIRGRGEVANVVFISAEEAWEEYKEEYLKVFFKIDSQKIIYYTWNKLYKKKVVDANSFEEKYSIGEYVEISTCNRKEYYIHSKFISENEELLSHENRSIVIDYGQSAVMHLLRMTSGLESMIVGEDQILGQVKDAKHKAVKDRHCGKSLDAVFTKAIHVGQVVRNKTNINKGSVSIGSAAIDLAEKHMGSLDDKSVLVIGAGKMGKLVAKALAEKDLNAIFVANRTYYVAVELAKDLGGQAILFNDLEKYLPENGTILDLGGGAGVYSFSLANKGYIVYLSDLSENLIAQAKKYDTINSSIFLIW